MRVIAKNLTLRLNDTECSQLRVIASAYGQKLEPTVRRIISEAEIKPRTAVNCADLLLELSTIGKQINQIALQANIQKWISDTDASRAVALVQQAYTLIEASL